MRDLLHNLFDFMQDRCSGAVESPAVRRAYREFDRAMDELERRTDHSFCDDLYNTVLICISEEQYAAFRLGLRLGTELHTL